MQFMLIHGGTFDDRCWAPMREHLQHPSVTVIQPGRSGKREDEIRTLGLSDYRAEVASTVASTPGDLILVAHSLAGVSVGAGLLTAPDRIRHVVLVSCVVPEEGSSVLAARGQDRVRGLELRDEHDPVLPSADIVRDMAGDMTAEQLDHAISISVAEPARVLRCPATLEGYDVPVPMTWVRLTRDTILSCAQQNRMAARVGVSEVVDLDAGHLAMLSRPEDLAGICNRIADGYAD